MSTVDEGAARRHTSAELTHWRLAVESLADLDVVAAPEAWESLERYLQHGIRDRLAGLVGSLLQEVRSLEVAATGGQDVETTRRGVLRLRRRYLQAETILDFYGDAIATRTNPATRELLRGYDTLTSDSMAATLTPLGIDPPPTLVYLDKGLGASILRAGIQLWDRATGLADAWESWSGEIAADTHAFCQAGWAPVVALANVVDGSTADVFRVRLGDPHPPPWIRVMFNVALCRSWFGAGPWDDVATVWSQRHPAAAIGGEVGQLARLSVEAMTDIVDTCTRRPARAFRGVSLSAVLDPKQVEPSRLRAFESQAGGTLLTSSYLRRRHPLRILAVLTSRVALDPTAAEGHQRALRTWVRDLGAEAAPRPSTADRAA